MEEIWRTDGHILRRNGRASLDFDIQDDPTKATPEENTFEFRRGNGVLLGRIVFTRFEAADAEAETPWGKMTVSKPRIRSPYEVTAGGNTIASFSHNLFNTKISIAFAKGERMQFNAKLITKDFSRETDSGMIGIIWEGEFNSAGIKQDGWRLDMPKDVSDAIDAARAEYKRRKKQKLLNEGEPKSIPTPFYIQWRVLLTRDLEGRDDVLSALVLIACYRFLEALIPQGG